MKPIIFTTEMVKAILAGRKSMTRRIVKEPYQSYPMVNKHISSCEFDFHYVDGIGQFTACPYGKPGDILYVREAWCNDERGSEDGKSPCYYYKADFPDPSVWKWKSPCFMPKAAARIFLRVTDVRVERLRDITEEDAIAEGVDMSRDASGYLWYRNYLKGSPANFKMNPQYSYRTLWESIHGKGSWELNPWVWVIIFTRIDKPNN